MKLYINEKADHTSKSVVLDDLILTKDLPTTAGSKMLDGYVSLFEAEVVTKLVAAGYDISGKANVGELGIDFLGETSYFGACIDEDGKLVDASAQIVKNGDAAAAVVLDANGTPRRAAALANLVYVKPTYGTVSRFGVIPVACSGDTVGVMAKTVADCKDVLTVIAGHDDKDGTSLPAEKCALLHKDAAFDAVKKVAVVGAENAKVAAFVQVLKNNGVEVVGISAEELKAAKIAWNVLLSAELCNNVSRYDGVKYGYRTPNYTNIDELYTNSRSEAFGELLKTAILYGSDSLSTDKYMKVYDKALRVRRVICEYFGKLFAEFDAVVMPACSKDSYTLEDVKANKYLSMEENVYTAPASITGLPTVVAGGVQLIGKAFSENSLLAVAEMYEKEGK